MILRLTCSPGSSSHSSSSTPTQPSRRSRSDNAQFSALSYSSPKSWTCPSTSILATRDTTPSPWSQRARSSAPCFMPLMGSPSTLNELSTNTRTTSSQCLQASCASPASKTWCVWCRSHTWCWRLTPRHCPRCNGRETFLKTCGFRVPKSRD